MWCVNDVGKWWLKLQWQKKAHFFCWISFVDWLKWRRRDPSFPVCILWFTDTDLTQSIPLVILYWIQVPVVSEEPSTHTILFSLTGTRTEDIHAWVLFSNNHTSFAGTKLESCLWRRTLRGRCWGRSSSLIVLATSFKHLLSSFMVAGSWWPAESPASSCW